MPRLDDQVVNRDRSKFCFTLLTKTDQEPEGFTTRRHTGLGRRERLIPGSYIQATSRAFPTDVFVDYSDLVVLNFSGCGERLTG